VVKAIFIKVPLQVLSNTAVLLIVELLMKQWRIILNNASTVGFDNIIVPVKVQGGLVPVQ
jgi:hypothetical protein